MPAPNKPFPRRPMAVTIVSGVAMKLFNK